jgi:heptaprenyl diphosphate synthase
MRVGLANLPLLLALHIPADGDRPKNSRGQTSALPGQLRPAALLLFSPRNYCLLILLKILGQALVTGTLFSYVFLFSLAGSLSSAAAMYGLRRLFGARISLAGTGIAGAFVSNSAQLVLARFFLFGESALYLAPPFLAVGIASGAALGIFAGVFAAQSEFLRRAARAVDAAGTVDAARTGTGGTVSPREIKPPLPRLPFFFAALALAAAFLASSALAVKAALFLLFWLLTALSGKKPRIVFTVAVMAGITACNLFPPFGRVLAEWGPFTIALGSLENGVRKAISVEALIMLSKLIVPSMPKLPGPFGKLLAKTLYILDRFNSHKNALAPGKIRRKPKFPAGEKEDGMKNGLARRLDLLLLELSRDGTGPK